MWVPLTFSPAVVLAAGAPRAVGWTPIYVGTGADRRGQLHASWCKIALLGGAGKRKLMWGGWRWQERPVQNSMIPQAQCDGDLGLPGGH